MLEAAVVFAGALLLFVVEPLVARMLLPLFGGTAAVWLTALLFFQAALLGGYFLAHLFERRRWGKSAQLVLLALACAALPVAPSARLSHALANAPPSLRLLSLLAQSVGLPFLALATASPAVQALRARRQLEPWRLYALSNAASAIGLLLYPLALEPLLKLRAQAILFSIAFAIFAAAFTIVVLRAPSPAGAPPVEQSRFDARALCVLLPACSSALLLAITASITQNLAPIPLLWLLPLGLYLASFVVAFEFPRAYHRGWAATAVLLSLGGLAAMEGRVVPAPALAFTMAAVLTAFFVCSLALHAELSRLRPHASQLTRYYLLIAAGSVAGSLFVAIVAPILFRQLLELPVAIVACAALLGAAWLRVPSGRPFRALFIAAPAVLCAVLTCRAGARPGKAVYRGRNFYGAIAVRDEDPDEDGFVRVMVNGTINHGAQAYRGTPPRPTRDATTYYVEESGVGRALEALGAGRARLAVGIIGLGAGVLASYCRPGDSFVFYEINPLVEWIAREQFTFLSGCPGAQVRLGDARLVLDAEPPRAFDLLVLDAFSSDSIPVHLLTREAFALYARHLGPRGILAVHVSNRYLDLTPVVTAHGDRLGLTAVGIEDDGENDDLASPSAWILLGPPGALPAVGGSQLTLGKRQTWTDDESNLITLLR